MENAPEKKKMNAKLIHITTRMLWLQMFDPMKNYWEIVDSLRWVDTRGAFNG